MNTHRPAMLRVAGFVAGVLVAATAVLFWPLTVASAAAPPAAGVPAAGGSLARGPSVASLAGHPSLPASPSLRGQCSTGEWRDPANFTSCVGKLADLTTNEAQCVQAPTPESPDSGMAGWFASKPTSPPSRADGKFTVYGYAGYDYTTYDIGCIPTVMHPDYKFENTIANGEFMIAAGVIGAADALRDKAWDPHSMWGWADPLVREATQSIYRRVFTVFGGVTLAVIGLYLLWRSRQSDMNHAMTTAGWALLVMVAVTAIAAWPVRSAHLADSSLMTGLTAVHDAVGPPRDDIPPDQCAALPGDPAQCIDHRTPAQRASDVAVDNVLYRNWLRGELGSDSSPTALKYGPVLYDAKSLSWADIQSIHNDPAQRDVIIAKKQNDWEKVAKQIKTEDPEAYQYLQGTQGMDRIGSGFIALLSAVFFALFDITASILVLLGFLIFRWAVIAAPVLGTIGMLRPASAGVRRLANSVVAAIFNIVIFGAGSAIYLFGVDLILTTAALPPWLQITLVWLTGVVGWLLLRPYRRITQMGGRDPTAQVAGGSWHRRFFRDLREAAFVRAAVADRDREPDQPSVPVSRPGGATPPEAPPRPETKREGTGARPPEPPGPTRPEQAPTPDEPTPVPVRAARRRPSWRDPEVSEAPAGLAIYRPGGGSTAPVPSQRPESVPVRR